MHLYIMLYMYWTPLFKLHMCNLFVGRTQMLFPATRSDPTTQAEFYQRWFNLFFNGLHNQSSWRIIPRCCVLPAAGISSISPAAVDMLQEGPSAADAGRAAAHR